MNREYFEESFSEWLTHRSRFRRWQRHLAACLLAAGIIVLVWAPSFKSIGIVLVVIAAVEAVEFYHCRWSWIRGRLSVRGTNPIVVEISFDESGISTAGPTSSGHVKWNGVHELLETPKGLFIRIGDGMSFYVSKAAVSPASAVTEVLRLGRK